MLFGKWSFWASKVDSESGVSRLAKLKQVEKTTGKKPRKLADMPVLDESLVYIWDIFIELNNAGQGVISYQDILAYTQFKGALSGFEVDVIMNLNSLRTSA